MDLDTLAVSFLIDGTLKNIKKKGYYFMKDRKTYKILTWCSFFFPINRFYIGKTEGILLRCMSGNLMLFGWIGDLLYMDKTFDEAMAKRGYINTTIRNEKDQK